MNTRTNHLAASELFEMDDMDLETQVATPGPM